MHDDEEAIVPDEEKTNEGGGWTEVQETNEDEQPNKEDKEEIVPDETIHEVAVGKGLSGALKLLKDRGTLKESIEWGGRNMDKKKSKLVGIVDDDEKETQKKREIRIERTDEFGRILTPKEAFRMISHKFHGKGPGKMKQEKRMKQYQEELKMKQMKSSDTPSLSVERMREAQARLQTPYLVLSGHVKPGQTSDPKSGFATVEKDLPGGLTPMLGDRKVEHFLGIKRKAETSGSDNPKKPKSRCRRLATTHDQRHCHRAAVSQRNHSHGCRCFPPAIDGHRTASQRSATTHELTGRCRCFLSPQPLTPPHHATLREAREIEIRRGGARGSQSGGSHAEQGGAPPRTGFGSMKNVSHFNW
ncbi:U4/U6.U5 tri-snRNP-associated protein 1 [Vigna unguiculata]|uniref:U4/U6.U5 tri-snRNP-associated protein 1 n=1 Tax=Vigna unguiculata TaxID=3917 RepID=A0A4D6LBK1_VIGUN|nr:U4/U6.U5 tri-snRNP-associated protein 1 [Vigna unguiculata]